MRRATHDTQAYYASFKKKELGEQNLKKKFRYPVNLRPGFIVGMFEWAFSYHSKFVYKPTKASSKMDAFFIRRANLSKVFASDKTLVDTVARFNKFVLLDYINKIYLPIVRFQEQVVDFENEKKL
mmetsp:Transcript_6273/g.10212  ORF Transcript_6273/g.10212 Transcript_6273/m.10212 type:complete len:125 (+) Transcript_6273:203-577(+)